MGYIPVHMGLSIMTTVGDTENLSVNLVFLETTPSQHLLISPSIFDVWGHMRALCPPTGHPWRNAPIYRSILRPLGSFLLSFQPLETPETTTQKCVFTRGLYSRDSWLRRVFWRRMSLVALENGLMWCLRRGSSPRVSESVKNWSLWTKNHPRPWWRHLWLCDLEFYG